MITPAAEEGAMCEAKRHHDCHHHPPTHPPPPPHRVGPHHLGQAAPWRPGQAHAQERASSAPKLLPLAHNLEASDDFFGAAIQFARCSRD